MGLSASTAVGCICPGPTPVADARWCTTDAMGAKSSSPCALGCRTSNLGHRATDGGYDATSSCDASFQVNWKYFYKVSASITSLLYKNTVQCRRSQLHVWH